MLISTMEMAANKMAANKNKERVGEGTRTLF